jgi:arsenite methyltransferase
MSTHVNLTTTPNDMDVASVFDELPLWSAPFGTSLLDRIPLKKRTSMLDIGCGCGFPLIELGMRLGTSAQCYGVDPWASGVERARLKISRFGLSHIQVIEARAEHLPFPDHFFDLIVSNNGLNNVQDFDAALHECYRVARPGAQLYYTFNTAGTFQEFYDVYRAVLASLGLAHYIDAVNDHIHAKRRPVPEVEERFRHAGFTVTGVEENHFQYRFTDGSAMLNHSFINLAFMESWKNILPLSAREQCFGEIEARLNRIADSGTSLTLGVPFVLMTCERR